MDYLKRMEDVDWRPHPEGHDGVEMKVIRSEKNSGTESTIAWVKVEQGFEVPEHVHEDSDDNLYILKGEAKMKVDDEVFKIDEGCQVTVPKGVEHEIFEVEENLLIYDVFSPAVF